MRPHHGPPRRKDHIHMAGHARYLTLKAFLDELQVAKSTFYDWCDKGCAPRHIKLPNGQIRIRRTDLESWLESREVAA